MKKTISIVMAVLMVVGCFAFAGCSSNGGAASGSGTITGFDAFTVVLSSDGKQMVIYKHAISTIVPERPIPLTSPQET